MNSSRNYGPMHSVHSFVSKAFLKKVVFQESFRIVSRKIEGFPLGFKKFQGLSMVLKRVHAEMKISSIMRFTFTIRRAFNAYSACTELPQNLWTVSFVLI